QLAPRSPPCRCSSPHRGMSVARRPRLWLSRSVAASVSSVDWPLTCNTRAQLRMRSDRSCTLPMLECSSARCVCAPPSLSAGTSTPPRLSVSLRMLVIGDLSSVHLLVVFRKWKHQRVRSQRHPALSLHPPTRSAPWHGAPFLSPRCVLRS